MSSIHGHQVLRMMIERGEVYTKERLITAIQEKFGQHARFHTCSTSMMTAKELVDFLEAKKKFVPADNGFITTKHKICKQ